MTSRSTSPLLFVSPLTGASPPVSLSEYLPYSVHRAWAERDYVDGDRVLASSRELRSTYPSLPIGRWLMDDGWRGMYGRHIEELVLMDPDELDPQEYRKERPEEELRYQGRLADALRYEQWLLEGHTPPPIHVIQKVDGSYAVTDGHRRLYAHMRQHLPIRAWVSYTVPYTFEHNAKKHTFLTGLTYELATGLDSDTGGRWQGPED